MAGKYGHEFTPRIARNVGSAGDRAAMAYRAVKPHSGRQNRQCHAAVYRHRQFGYGSLMTNFSSLDLNIEFHQAIEQRRFLVQAASDEFGCRVLLSSGFQKAEPP